MAYYSPAAGKTGTYFFLMALGFRDIDCETEKGSDTPPDTLDSFLPLVSMLYVFFFLRYLHAMYFFACYALYFIIVA